MKVLVTGGAGYIGSHTCKALAAAGHEPVAYDNLSTGHRDAVRWGPLVAADLLDRDALSKAFATHRPDVVIHFAALAYVGDSVLAPDRYYTVNVTGTCTLLSAMHAAGVGKIVMSSSCATYGIPDGLPISERTPQHPINPYGFTKYAMERMAADFERAYGLKWSRCATSTRPARTLTARSANATNRKRTRCRSRSARHSAPAGRSR